MAQPLTSNSFLLATTPHSRTITPKNSRLTVFAKNNAAGPSLPFGLGKKAVDETPSEDNQQAKTKPFQFDFGKISDVQSLIPVVKNSPGLSFGKRSKDPGTVFVAGATGQAGIRIAQSLLRKGFSVRAGVPELGAAQELAQLAAEYKIISTEESKRFNAIQSPFQDAESIAKAIGNAAKVVVTIGPAENGPTTAVTTSDALEVIQAAQLAGVGHVAIIYDGSTVSTNNVLDGITSFFNNLFSKSQPLTITEFLQRVVADTDISYTLIKSNLTEDFSPESSYNIVVSAESSASTNDFKVSKSQIASLVADVFSNTAVAENKVVEVFADATAPSRPIDELFSAIPEDDRRKVYAEKLAKERAEEEAIKASEEARKAAQKLEEVKNLGKQDPRAASQAEEAQDKEEAAGTSVESLLGKAKDFSSGLSWDKFSSQIASAVQKANEEPNVRIATVRGQARAQNLPAKKAVVKKLATKPSFLNRKDVPKPKANQTESKAEVRSVFGGLFKQETIYVDDD